MNPKEATIVLVEDEPVIVDMYALKFKLSGLNLVVSPTAKDAIATVEKNKAEMVLLDLQLEDHISGFDILKTLKASPTTKHVVAFILSNKRAQGNKEVAQKLGAVDFLAKTEIKPDELVKIVKEQLEKI